MTIGEWIDSRDRSVPSALRCRLSADGPVSLEALTGAAMAELEAVEAGDPADRATAFSLLAADAYLTYACLWGLTEGGGTDLDRVLWQVAGEPEAAPSG